MSCTELMQVQLLVYDDNDDDEEEEEEEKEKEEDYGKSFIKFSTRRKFLEHLHN